MADSIERRVQVLADREEIKELTARYCWHVMRGEGEKIVDLFADDAVFDGSNANTGVARGREELLKFYRQVREPGAAIPFIHNHIIEVSGDEAHGTCAIEGRFARGGESLTGAGYYEDRYRRVDGHWRFAGRKLYFHHMVPLKQGWAEAKAATQKKA